MQKNLSNKFHRIRAMLTSKNHLGLERGNRKDIPYQHQLKELLIEMMGPTILASMKMPEHSKEKIIEVLTEKKSVK